MAVVVAGFVVGAAAVVGGFVVLLVLAGGLLVVLAVVGALLVVAGATLVLVFAAALAVDVALAVGLALTAVVTGVLIAAADGDVVGAAALTTPAVVDLAGAVGFATFTTGAADGAATMLDAVWLSPLADDVGCDSSVASMPPDDRTPGSAARTAWLWVTKATAVTTRTWQ